MDDNQSLLQQVLERYGLSTASVTPLHSYNNQVYRVERADKQRFSLRICGFLNMQHRSMEDEMRWLDFVAQHNPRLAPRPIANQQGELVTVIATPAGDRLACLFAWIEGTELRGAVTPADLSKIGRMVAALHNIARQFPFPDADNDFRSDYRYDQSLMLQHRQWMAKHRDTIGPERVALLDRAIDTVLAAMDRMGTTPANFGMIHADLTLSNLLVHHEEIYLIDFEQLGRGHFLHDLAVLWSELQKNVGDIERHWQSFVAGYSEVAELPFRSEAELNPFIIATQLIDLDWIYHADNPAVRAEYGPQLPLIYESIRQRVEMNHH
jgi:Ser/Thr protein kinase RdoA (MazF antagonist)